MNFINLDRQQQRLEPTLSQNIAEVLSHKRFILGPEVTSFEERLAAFIGVKHCIGVGNGTDALLIALMALNVGSGDEVITQAFSYIAAIEVITLLGATPVLVDVDPLTFTLDSDRLGEAITPKTKAIIPVSLYGQCPDMASINTIAEQHNIPVIEDAAQSLGATYRGQMSGSLSTIACTSFFPSKPLGCYGDGGACFTDDDNLATAIRSIRAHGQAKRYQHVRLGLNSRLDSLQAAILLAKLDIFASEIAARQTHAAIYDSLLADIVTVPFIAEDRESGYGIYTIRVKNRDTLVAHLKHHGIPTAVHYPCPVNEQPAYTDIDAANDYPNSKLVSQEVLSLPFDAYITEEEQRHVAESISHFFN